LPHHMQTARIADSRDGLLHELVPASGPPHKYWHKITWRAATGAGPSQDHQANGVPGMGDAGGSGAHWPGLSEKPREKRT